MSKAEQTLTPEMREIITSVATAAEVAAAAEMRKPAPPTTQELADLQAKQEERRATAESIKQKQANDRYIQEHVCTHKHKGQLGGTHCVYVRDNDVPTSPGFVLCQVCLARFRPDEPVMRKLDPNALFDTAKWNTLMQDCQMNGAEILG